MTPALAEPPTHVNGSDPIDHTEFPYRFDVVRFDEMFVDHEYQRPLTKLSKTIAAYFDPALVGTLIVNQRNPNKPKFAVIDGQTRMVGMSERGMEAAPCVVFTGLTKRQEAALFAKLQTQRRNITTYERFRASLAAKDKTALGVVEIVRRHGFTLSTEPDAKNLRAIGSLESAYRKDPELLENIMFVLGSAWPDQRGPDIANGQTIPGLDLFLRRHPDVDLDKLAQKLGKISPEILLYRANSIREGTGGSRPVAGCMSEAIAGVYGIRATRSDAGKKRGAATKKATAAV